MSCNELVRVLTSKLSEVARAVPVGADEVPYVPEWAYIVATALPVGELSFFKLNVTFVSFPPDEGVKDWPA
jgi:hypothetical protein